MFDPRKMDPKFLVANFECSRLSSARDDKNRLNCPSYLHISFWPKKLLKFILKLKKWDKNWSNWVELSDLPIFCDFRLILVLSRQNLTIFLAKIKKRAWTVLTIFIIPDCCKSKTFKIGLLKVGMKMPIFAMGQLCQGRPVSSKWLF